MLKRLIPGLAVVALLSACATTEPSSAARSHGSVADAVASANAAAKAGQNDKAIAILQGAAQAHPADKTPWVRMAQIRYDADDYGQAIVLAQQALQRDADDTLAHSITAVSGLRVASKALAEMTRKNNLSGTIRSEAQDLAKLLRAALGEEVLVPGGQKGRSAAAAPQKRPPQTPVTSSSAQKKTSSDDPFEGLK
ncbi:tetratricopeptide repeat protein [Massilia sp. GCM10020059]|uniref:Tetratricopeptide repeat protein n=1 Tax=Massilia agrisoli TaxID=2892444 RepID=A0ABS8IVM3_9BURK|nr:tetratricopeptide repeat protein [Massilia agrisoli]MCC6072203.1 tetratricopeptide repeat protein [Massilia agrisoli]